MTLEEILNAARTKPQEVERELPSFVQMGLFLIMKRLDEREKEQQNEQAS